MRQVGGFEVVQIVASLQDPEGSAVPTLEKATALSQGDPVRPLQPMTTVEGMSEGRLQRLTSASLFIGDLRLGALKARLGPVGVQATLAGGGLLVCKAATAADRAQVVTVRKAGKGELVVEGAAGPLYTAVKRVVYAMHASTA